MICSMCNKNEATTHIKRVINGKLTEYHLCAECSIKYGYQYPASGIDMASILGGIFSLAPNDENIERCKKCGSSFNDIKKKGKIGCAECYNTFRIKLRPMVSQIHGIVAHKGKKPGGSALRVIEQNNSIVPLDKLASLKEKLTKAIADENFEQAAMIRDQIKEIENHE